MQFVFAIYSCKKNKDTKTNLLYKLLQNKLDNNTCKIYIIYGDETLSTEYQIIDDLYLVLKCGDLYDHLSQKTLCLFKVIEKIHPTIKGVFKCDDDILPNVEKIKELFRFILYSYDPIPYLGLKLEHYEDHYYTESSHKFTNEKYKNGLLIHTSSYAAGPLYYLSIDSIHTMNNMPIINEIMADPIDFMFEDNMVGYLLNQHNIYPCCYNTYFDDISEYTHRSVQNIDNRIRNLYVPLHGGLGNQLFQVAFGFELANKNKRFLILVYQPNTMTHNTYITEFFSTIFSEFNYLNYNDVNFTNVIEYREQNCFEYKDIMIEHTDKDYYLHGYFQNKKYLDVYKTELLNIFCKNRSNYFELKNKKVILEKYPSFTNSYFIHIRRGDYVNHPLYTLDLDTYLHLAISYILEENKENPHFYIFSNDIEFCKSYYIFKSINKTFIENMNTLDSFYCMSLCKKGGICANSTFSGWATMLNNNPDKIVVIPKNWINVDYTIEIPFDYTITF